MLSCGPGEPAPTFQVTESRTRLSAGLRMVRFMNDTASGRQPSAVSVSTTSWGEAKTLMRAVSVMTFEPQGPATVTETLYVPGER